MNGFAVKVKNSRAEIYDGKTGAYQRSVGYEVVSAQISGDIIQVSKKNGKVEIYDVKLGAYIRTL